MKNRKDSAGILKLVTAGWELVTGNGLVTGNWEL
jgi:hypothetical protein